MFKKILYKNNLPLETLEVILVKLLYYIYLYKNTKNKDKMTVLRWKGKKALEISTYCLYFVKYCVIIHKSNILNFLRDIWI
jgi:hypothetical protein